MKSEFFTFFAVTLPKYLFLVQLMKVSIQIKALQEGDPQAFKALFDQFYRQLYAYLLSLSKDTVLSEELLQQTFIQLWEQRLVLDSTKNIKGYLFAIARSRFIDHVRKQQIVLSSLDEFQLDSLDAIVEEVNESIEERIQLLQELIDKLPEKCREILLMNKRDGYSYKKIAEELDISVKTVESQMRIAFTKIREGFKNDTFLFVLLESSNSFVYFEKYSIKREYV